MMGMNEIEAAKEFRASLLKKIDTHRQAISKIESLLEGVDEFIGDDFVAGATYSEAGGNGATPSPQAGTADVKTDAANLIGLTRKQAAPVVVRAANRWLTAREIIEYMGKGGLNTSARTALLSLYPVLEGHPELQSLRGKGGKKIFGLTEWELPKGYNGKPAKRLLKRRRHSGSGPPSMGDAVEEVLSREGSLHADKLVKAVQDMGVVTTKKNMVDGMRRDTRDRFKNLGNNVWTLRHAK